MTEPQTRSEHLLHLLESGTVFVPYMTVGHHGRDDPDASPVVESLVTADELPPHPYSGKPMAMVQLAGDSLVVVAIDRLAHDRDCDVCRSSWEALEAQLQDFHEGEMLSAGMRIQTSEGPAMLLVDATDLPV